MQPKKIKIPKNRIPRRFRTKRNKRIITFSLKSFLYVIIIGAVCGQILRMGGVNEVEFPFFEIFDVPILISTGIWLYGFIGQKEVSIIWPMIGAYLAYPVRYFIENEITWTPAMVLGAAIAFEYKKEWKTNKSRRNVDKWTGLVIILCLIISGIRIFSLYYEMSFKVMADDYEDSFQEESFYFGYRGGANMYCRMQDSNINALIEAISAGRRSEERRLIQRSIPNSIRDNAYKYVIDLCKMLSSLTFMASRTSTLLALYLW